MPIMQAFIATQCSDSDRRRLFDAYAQCFMSVLGSPRERIRILLVPLQPEWVCVGGVVAEPIVLISVYLLQGRTPEQKSALVEALAQATAACTGVAVAGVRTMLHDMHKTDVGFGTVTALALEMQRARD